jgi:hypothetical protein
MVKIRKYIKKAIAIPAMDNPLSRGVLCLLRPIMEIIKPGVGKKKAKIKPSKLIKLTFGFGVKVASSVMMVSPVALNSFTLHPQALQNEASSSIKAPHF